MPEILHKIVLLGESELKTPFLETIRGDAFHLEGPSRIGVDVDVRNYDIAPDTHIKAQIWDSAPAHP